MQPGDKVYYLYTGKGGTPVKVAGVVLGLEADGVLIRIGRYDVQTNKVNTLESVVAASTLKPRTIPWTFEDELQAPG
ncbi:MAG: hypothetical protein GY875_05020 [Gammaproteobacteria bacterium]|nr:hypothetical protein [Gammaproteobacteria bacterium]